MGKKDDYQIGLKPHLEVYLQNGMRDPLMEMIEASSNLPGPRANLEFAAAFADSIAEQTQESADEMWELCTGLVELSSEDAPVNDPKEFIPFCGTLGLGVVGSKVEGYCGNAITMLKVLSRDRRWRMREAVRMGLQRLLKSQPERVLEVMNSWIPEGDPLEMRAIVAAVSEPELLHDQDLADWALRFHKEILDRIGPLTDRKAKPFRALRKALGYTLSILVCALPESGLKLIDELIASKDTDLHWIARSNLKKRRLLRRFPEEAESRLRGL